jgi:hypothetical protein
VRYHEIDVSVGETVKIGDYAVTIVDIEGCEIRFRIDAGDDHSLLMSAPREEEVLVSAW